MLDNVPAGVQESEVSTEMIRIGKALQNLEENLKEHASRLNVIKQPSRPIAQAEKAAQGPPPDEALSPLGENLRSIRRKAESLVRLSNDLNQDLAI